MNDAPLQSEQRTTDETTCCIVGGGPAGAFLALLLARKGVEVTLLEAHPTFDREFRADSIHPAIMEILDEIGLVEALLQQPHTQMWGISFMTKQGLFTISDFRTLNTKYNYMFMMPQAKFLEFLVSQAERYPNFQVRMGARAERLLEQDGVIHGVVYRDQGDNALHEIKALLTVAADGRFSRIRALAQMEPVVLSQPIDVLWTKLPRQQDDPDRGGVLHLGEGHFIILFNRDQFWEVGFTIKAGTYQQVRAEGIEKLGQALVQLVPWFANRVDTLRDWNEQVFLLHVEASRLTRWHRPGLLFIGDAAHVMTPIGGFGNNLAIQDAVVAANILAKPLKEGTVTEKDLAKVQRKRSLATKILQGFQVNVQKRIDTEALNTEKPFQVPLIFRLLRGFPPTRNVQARLTAFGPFPAHVQQ